MALGFSQGSGGADFLPVVKYDARAGRMFRMDRGDNGNEPIDVTAGFTAVFDFENVETGYIRFMAGAAPDFQVVPLGQERGAPRSPEHKEGFRLVIKLSKDHGGDVREFASTAIVVRNAVNALHDEYVAGQKANPGKLPVVELTGTLPVTSGKGERKSTNYAPVFKIKSWAARPQDLTAQPRGGASPAPAAGAPQIATPPATGSTQVPPPVARSPEPAGADDFG
jgi:hypothetical protein